MREVRGGAGRCLGPREPFGGTTIILLRQAVASCSSEAPRPEKPFEGRLLGGGRLSLAGGGLVPCGGDEGQKDSIQSKQDLALRQGKSPLRTCSEDAKGIPERWTGHTKARSVDERDLLGKRAGDRQ